MVGDINIGEAVEVRNQEPSGGTAAGRQSSHILFYLAIVKEGWL